MATHINIARKTLDEFTLGRKLGEGATAKVYRGEDECGNSFAIKVFRLDNERFNEQ